MAQVQIAWQLLKQQRISKLEKELLGIKISVGDHFVGIDCCNEPIDGVVTKILQNTVIVECRVKYHIVKKSEIENQGQQFDGFEKENKFNRTHI